MRPRSIIHPLKHCKKNLNHRCIRTDYSGLGSAVSLKSGKSATNHYTNRQMSFTNVEPRLRLEARTMLTKLVGILIADGSIDAAEDAPFNPFCPGDDPNFHELVQDLVDQTLEFMADTAHDMVQY